MQISTGKRKVEHLRGEPRICFDANTADDGGDQQCQRQTHPLGGHRFHIWGFRACGLRAQGLLILNFQRLPILCYRISKHAPRVHRPKITFAHSGFVCSMIRSVHYYARSGDPSFILSTSNTTKYLSVTKYTMGSIGVENTASHASRTVTTQTDSHHSPLNRIIRDACQPKNHSNPQ